MKEYTAYLIFEGLSKHTLKQLSDLVDKFGFEVDFDENFLEFEYSGRDAPLNVIKFFYELAKVVQSADGELVCELVNDDGDNEFEFYQVQSGQLTCQSGKIVRGREQIIEID